MIETAASGGGVTSSQHDIARNGHMLVDSQLNWMLIDFSKYLKMNKKDKNECTQSSTNTASHQCFHNVFTSFRIIKSCKYEVKLH